VSHASSFPCVTGAHTTLINCHSVGFNVLAHTAGSNTDVSHWPVLVYFINTDTAAVRNPKWTFYSACSD
jgi:hypothetical protein